MTTSSRWATAAAISLAVSGGWGCGSSSSAAPVNDAAADSGQGASGDADVGAPQGCRKLVVKDLIRDPDFGKPGENYSALVGVPDPKLGGDVPDEFQIQLYEFNGMQAPGTFDLSAGRETNFSTCAHCVVVMEDLGADGAAARYFFQESGELALTVNPTPTTGEVKGSLNNAKLVEVTIDYAGKTYKSTPVPGGACLQVDSLDIDTTIPVADAGP